MKIYDGGYRIQPLYHFLWNADKQKIFLVMSFFRACLRTILYPNLGPLEKKQEVCFYEHTEVMISNRSVGVVKIFR